jgi:plasmid stabilization system protein ParE
MKYTVTWTPSAEKHLAQLWVHANDRQAVADSADRIDRLLKNDAETKGEPFGPFRALYDDPLSVLYVVDAADCMVRVIQVRRNP